MPELSRCLNLKSPVLNDVFNGERALAVAIIIVIFILTRFYQDKCYLF